MKKLILHFFIFVVGALSLMFLVQTPIYATHTGQINRCSCHADCNGLAPNNICSAVANVQNPCQVANQNKNGVCGKCPNAELGVIGGAQCGRFGPNYQCVAVSPQHNTCVAVGGGGGGGGGVEPGYGPPPARQNCAIPPTDIMLVIDKSHSMRNPQNNPNIGKARSAATAFVRSIQNYYFGPNPVRVGLAAFDAKGHKILNPTIDYQTVINKIHSNELDPAPPPPQGELGTCLECAIDYPSRGGDVLEAFAGPAKTKKVVVILTDGNITSWVTEQNDIKKCDNNSCDKTGAEQSRQAAVRLNDHFNKSVQFWVVQFGDTKYADVFKDIVGLQNNYYDHGEWNNVTGNNWDPLFQAYASEIRGGFVYSVATDGNTGARYAGWTATLSCGSDGGRSTITQGAFTDAKFAGVPGGTDYTISFQPPAGYDVSVGETNSKSAPVYPGIPPGGPGGAWGGACTAGTADECEFTTTRFDRLGRISGCVYNDVNSSKTKESDAEAFPNTFGNPNITIFPSSGTPTISSNGCYSFSNLHYGTYTIDYTGLPTGFKATFPSAPNRYTFFYYGAPPYASISPLNPTGSGRPSISNGDAINADFGITNALPWIQTAGFNVRNDQSGFNNHIQTTSQCNPVMMRNGNGGTPGVLYTSGPNTFSPGTVSSKNWIVANTGVSSTLYNPGVKLKTSYDEMLTTLERNEVERKQLTDITTCTNLLNCGISSGAGGIESKAYIANGDVRLGAVLVQGQKKAVILVNGTLRITQNVRVDPGSFLMFVVKGDIVVDDVVGRTSNYLCAGDNTTAEVQGIYVTNSDFRVQGAACPTPNAQLNVAGSIVTNADAVGGGKLNNNRTLCAVNLERPSLTISPRLDFILNAPTYILRPSTSWQEVAP